jgi:Ca2+-binding RTX toxin-like protein
VLTRGAATLRVAASVFGATASTIDLASLVAAQGSTIFGVDVDDWSGFTVSSAGDVNGDGFDDLLIGAYAADAAGNAKSNAGESYVIFGSASPPATIDLANLGAAGITIWGADASDFSGISVSSAGDVNGDGFDDLLIGAYKADAAGNAKPYASESYVIFRSASPPATIDLANLGAAGITIWGADASDWSGISVSSAGDVNGDGFDDLIIGANRAGAAGNAKTLAGESYVIFGSASPPATIDLANLGTAGITIWGADASDWSGISVSNAGDVNGDGFDDLLIGAQSADAAGNAKLSAGDNYVVFGSASPPATIDLANLGTAGITIFGADASDLSGYSVSSAGDVNGDGFDDLIIGANRADAAGNVKVDAGESYVIFGSASPPATIDLANLGTAGITIWGSDAGDRNGFSVSGAGDVNGDGLDDLLIGSREADAAGNAKLSAGDSHVIFGSATPPTTIDLANLGAAGITIWGADAGDRSGRSVSNAGDVNGDGFDDLIIGAANADAAGNAKSDAGDSYVIFGGNFTASTTHLGTAAAETLTGSASANVMNGGRGNDTLLGNGGADVLIGGQGSDTLAISDLAFGRVVGGTGSDTLRIDGSGLTLDLTTLKDNRLLGIEQIDLTGTGDNTLVLSVRDVLNLSDESNTLTVHGNSGDSIQPGSGWTRVADQTIDGVTYQVLTSGAATLKVASSITGVPDSLLAPTSILLSNSSIAENAGPNSLVGTLSAVDANTNDSHTFAFTGNASTNDNGSFQLVGNRLQALNSFNYEAKASYLVQIRATDSTGLYVERDFNLTVTNVNETPTDIQLSATTIAENSVAGSVVGLLAATDPDAGATFTYALVTGTGSSDNASFTIVGGELRAAASFDFEAKSSYAVRVRTTDNGGLSFEEPFVITVTNVNESPVVVINQATISGNEGVTLTNSGIYSDPEGRTGVTLSASVGTVTLNATAGTWTWSRAVSDGPASQNVTITATDPQGGSDAKTFSYTVNNVAPTLTISGASTVTAGGTYQLNLASTDPAGTADTITSWNINWGDGTANTTTAGNATSATHTYSSAGTYTITATATDEDGTWNSNSLSVTAQSGGTTTRDLTINKLTGFTANGTTTLSLTYDVVGVAAPTFSIGFYKSSDTQFGSDTLIKTVTISAAADLTLGPHTKTWSTGTAATAIPLPGAGTTDTADDYYLIAVLDPADAVAETDTIGTNEDNVSVFSGIYYPGSGAVMIHGREDAADTLTISSTMGVTLNSAATVTYSNAGSVRARLHDGDDTLSAAAVTKPVFAWGGSGADNLTTGTAADYLGGGDGNDTLTGNAAVDILEGMGGNDTLVGGAGNDTYRFNADTALGTDTITELSTGGTGDLLDFSTTQSTAVTVNLATATVQVVNANLSLVLGGNNLLERVTGGGQGDSLTGNTLANILIGGSGNDTLTGGTGNDTYRFDADGALGSDTLVETVTSGGTDLLDFSLTTTLAVNVDLTVNTSQVINANLTLNLGNAGLFENVTGGSLNDLLVGNALTNTLTGGAGNDKLIGGAANDTLVGGAGNDTYSFAANTALGLDTLTEAAGAGDDLLDFSETTAVGVTVDLASTVNQVVNANLTIKLSSATGFEMVLGSVNADTIRGNTLSNAIWGGAGADTLYGFGARDLLFGGSGADRLEGGDDEDILLGGHVSYYNETTRILDRIAIDAIRAEWVKTTATYATRIANLRAGVGTGVSAKLNSTTVTSDGTDAAALDTLFGQLGNDWFWRLDNDTIGDLDGTGAETVN